MILTIAAWLAVTCGPNLPPTTVPPPPAPELAPFAAALKDYVDKTQPYRRQAAQTAERVPDKTNSGAERSLRTRQTGLADALKNELRPGAKQGELFGTQPAESIHRAVDEAFAGLRRDLLTDALAEQNESGKAEPKPVTINEFTDAPRVPPLLLESLPPLPKQLQYAFAGRTLVLRDADAQVVVDYLPDVLPAPAPPGPRAAPSQPVVGAAAPLPMPSLRGATECARQGNRVRTVLADFPAGIRHSCHSRRSESLSCFLSTSIAIARTTVRFDSSGNRRAAPGSISNESNNGTAHCDERCSRETDARNPGCA